MPYHRSPVVESTALHFTPARQEAEKIRESIERNRADLRLTVMETRIRLAEIKATLNRIQHCLARG